MSVGGSEIHERLAHFFIDFYSYQSVQNAIRLIQKKAKNIFG